MCLVERQPPHGPRLATRGELVLRARAEGARHLVARRALVAGDLGVRATAAHPLEQMPAKRRVTRWRAGSSGCDSMNVRPQPAQR